MDNHMDNNPNGNRPDNNKGPGRQDPNKNHQSILAFLVCLLVTLVCFAMFTNMLKDNSSEITYDKFIEMVDDGDVKEVTLQSNTLTITPKHQSSGFSEEVYYANQMESVDKLTERLEGTGIKFEYKKPDAAGEIISMLVSVLLPTILLFVLLTVFMRRMNKGGGMMGVGKSRAKAYIQKDTGITFRDVAGQDEAKESLQEVVDFLHNPGKYTTIGAKLPKGALLVGPPGTGKTLLAKAVAGEAHVPFFSLSGSEFVEMFVGVGASRVRDLFEEAKKNAPCIIFIDEIDAIGKSRDSHYGGGNDEREQTLNQLLAEMDGFDTSKGLLILAATNRPEVLDPALLRPGRFDRRVIVDRPDLKGRIEILKVHARNVHLDETVDFENIALATSGAVGSDLANMINEAAILAVKSGRSAVSQKDLLEAVEVVLVGKEKKDRILSAQERRIVSYHEVGHALVSALQKDAEPVQKITIVPRTMGALGYVMQVPEEEKYLNTKKELEAMLVGYLGGRAAEELVFDTVTTGAANDIEPALLRPGRFDRRVIVDRPDLKGRIEILKVHARNVHLDETVDFENIALATSGAVGSDLANMINEAAILAVKSGRSAVSQKDLLEAVEVVLVGKEKKDRILSAQERRIVSYHEVGHALVSALQKDAEPVQKITIVPRTMGALGYVMQVPEEEKYLNTKKELEAMLVGYLGGRAAEELVFDTVTTGAANDIEQATKVARAMITQYGMSDKFGLMGLATQESQYLSGRAVLNCGDDTATEVDHEVMILLHNSYEEAKRLIGSHREALDKIADYLIRRETITGKEFMKIFHAVERGIEIPKNLDDLVIPEEKQNTVTLDKPEIQ